MSNVVLRCCNIGDVNHRFGRHHPTDDAAPPASFKLVGTVVTANGADSFAMVRRTADSQLVQLRAGDRVEGLTVSAIEPDRVVLAGAAQAIVIEADPEPAWAGDPAPFGH